MEVESRRSENATPVPDETNVLASLSSSKPPKFLAAPQDVTFVFGQDIELSCCVLESSPQNVSWYRNGIKISDVSDKAVDLKANHSRLRFSCVSKSDTHTSSR